MIVAAIRQTADWLADGTTGVNALLAAVPKDVTDTAPPTVTIYDETRDAWVARGAVPRAKTGNGPLLLLRGPDEAELPIFGTQGDAGAVPVEVRVLYLRRALAATVDSDDAVRDVYQTFRAIARSLALQYDTQEAAPARNSVDLYRPTLRVLRGLAPLDPNKPDGELITGALAITFPAVDPWAMAAIS
jgi:hypothetical protein